MITMICYACQNGSLSQTYPNTIYCEACGAKWYNNSLSQFGKSQKSYYSSKYRKSRA